MPANTLDACERSVTGNFDIAADLCREFNCLPVEPRALYAPGPGTNRVFAQRIGSRLTPRPPNEKLGDDDISRATTITEIKHFST